MAFRLHSRLVALNIGAIAVATVIVGYFFFGGSLRSAFESEIQQQLYRSATLAKSYVRVQTASPIRSISRETYPNCSTFA